MGARGRRLAIIAGAVAASTLFAATLRFADDLAWWWRLRGTDLVLINDLVVGDYALKKPGAIIHAQQATKRFICSLQKKEPADVEIGNVTAVVFSSAHRSKSPEVRVSVLLDGFLASDRGIVRFEGALYHCGESSWLGYIRDVLGPLEPELLSAWRTGTGDSKKRFHTAGALALVAPGTDGVLELLCGSLAGKRGSGAALLLGEMGPFAAAAAPALERLLADSKLDEGTRVAATRALAKIRGEPR